MNIMYFENIESKRTLLINALSEKHQEVNFYGLLFESVLNVAIIDN